MVEIDAFGSSNNVNKSSICSCSMLKLFIDLNIQLKNFVITQQFKQLLHNQFDFIWLFNQLIASVENSSWVREVVYLPF